MHFYVIKSKTLIASFVIILVAVLLAVSVDGTANAQVFFNKSDRKIPIYCVQTEEKKIAITFDAAWGAEKTNGIMQILKENNCNATFFLVGFWVDKYPQIVKEIDSAGFEIGTHSNTHPDLSKMDSSQINSELKLSIDKISAITNKQVKLFRSPFGAYNNTLLSVAESLNLKTIQWDVDSLDWRGISATAITSNIIKRVKQGSIILCHNNSDCILEALPIVISTLKQRGYKFVAVGDLIYNDNYSIDSTGKQIKN